MSAQPLGAHSPRLVAARDLLHSKARREQSRFLVEGPTLLAEARDAGVVLEAIFSTSRAYEQYGIVSELDARGVPTFLIDERALRKLSDVESPAGVVAIGKSAATTLEQLFAEPGLVLILASLNDPGNAGTLVRSADAFGVRGVIFGSGGVEPYHPKLVRAAMGSLFRLRTAVADPDGVRSAARGGWTVAGLSTAGEPLPDAALPRQLVLIVGHERRGLGPWGELCGRLLAIPMAGRAESLNAAVAGSIALYEAVRRMA